MFGKVEFNVLARQNATKELGKGNLDCLLKTLPSDGFNRRYILPGA